MTFNLFNYISLAGISLLGFFIVKKDLLLKKISNKLIIIGFLFGFSLFFFGFFNGYVDPSYLEKVFINTLLAFFVAFIIWQLGFWPAGDSKLFILLAFLLPLHYYRNSYLQFFPAFALLFNIFIAFLLFVVFKSAVSFMRNLFHFLKLEKNKAKIISEYLKIKKKGILEKFKNKKTILQTVSKNIFQLALALCFSLIITKFISKSPINLVSLIIFMVVFRFVYACINFYTQKYSCEKIGAENIKIGDNLEKSQLSQSEDGKKIIKKLGKLRPEGLEDFQIEILQKHFLDNNIKKIIIHKTIPFSAWILVGAILTVFFNGIIRISFP